MSERAMNEKENQNVADVRSLHGEGYARYAVFVPYGKTIPATGWLQVR